MDADVFLRERGLEPESTVPVSEHLFPDGAHFRIEIPSVEGPQVLRDILDEAALRGVTINRVSQGSGGMLHTRDELTEMAHIAAGNGLEVSMFVGPREGWDIGAQARAGDGPALLAEG